MATPLRLYVETSVFGFALDKSERNREKQEATTRLFDQIKGDRLAGFVSSLVLAELGGHLDPGYRGQLLKLVTDHHLAQLPPQPDPGPLARILIEGGVIPPSQPADAAHLASAILHPGIDVLVS